MDKVNIKHKDYKIPGELSGGEQQRVAIARAFVTNPAFIFADEPTGNLDEATSANVADLMFDFAEETGSALIIVTHSPALAERADNCFALSEAHLEKIK